MNADVIATIESAIKEGLSHLEKLHHSDQYLQRIRPFTAQTMETIDDDAVLHRLEPLHVITSVETRQRFRNLRNNLAHDYPENLRQTADTLNELLESWHELEAIHTQACDGYWIRV